MHCVSGGYRGNILDMQGSLAIWYSALPFNMIDASVFLIEEILVTSVWAHGEWCNLSKYYLNQHISYN